MTSMHMYFDSYKMDLEHSMIEHLKKIYVMIHDLNALSNIINEERQIQAVLGVIAKSWDNEAYYDVQ